MKTNPRPYDGLLHFDGKLTLDQVTAVRTAWENLGAREIFRLTLVARCITPNRLHGAYINERGEAV